MEFIYRMMETLNAMHNGTLKTLKKKQIFSIKSNSERQCVISQSIFLVSFSQSLAVGDRKSSRYHSSNTNGFRFFCISFFFFIKMPLSDKKEHTTKKIDWQIEQMVYTVECVTLFVLRRVYWCDMNQYSKTNDTQAQPGSMNSNPTVKGKSL